MSDTSTDDPGKPMKQPTKDLSGAMAQLSVTTDNSDNCSSSSKNLSDMPFDVVGLIIERSDYKEQLILRKTSKSLRVLVDKQKPSCKSIKVVFWIQYVFISFNNLSVMYANRENKRITLEDLAFTLKNPRLQLEEFGVRYHDCEKIALEKHNNNFHNVLKSLNHQVSVKKLELHESCPFTLHSILSCLKPGFLEKIKLHIRGHQWRVDSTTMDRIALLEQWKQAEELELQNSFNRFPLKYATHFKRFRIFESEIEPFKFNHIKNFLSKLDNLEQCSLHFMLDSLGPDSTIRQLGEPVFRNKTEEFFHHPIPNSDYYFEIKNATGTFCLDVKKKKRGIHS